MEMTVKKISLAPLTNYIRTPEDDENDRRELEWKTRQNREGLTKFLLRNPSGRVVPRGD